MHDKTVLATCMPDKPKVRNVNSSVPCIRVKVHTEKREIKTSRPLLQVHVHLERHCPMSDNLGVIAFRLLEERGPRICRLVTTAEYIEADETAVSH